MFAFGLILSLTALCAISPTFKTFLFEPRSHAGSQFTLTYVCNLISDVTWASIQALFAPFRLTAYLAIFALIYALQECTRILRGLLRIVGIKLHDETCDAINVSLAVWGIFMVCGLAVHYLAVVAGLEPIFTAALIWALRKMAWLFPWVSYVAVVVAALFVWPVPWVMEVWGYTLVWRFVRVELPVLYVDRY